jgi:hypothetical protein
MIGLQIQKVAGTGENPSLASLHRKIAAACRKRRLPIPSYGTVLRRLQAYDARAFRKEAGASGTFSVYCSTEKAVYTLTVNAE